MMNLTNLTIAVIGTKDQTAVMRLAGVKHYAVIDAASRTLGEDIRNAVREFTKDTTFRMIMVPEDWMNHIEDIITQMRQSKKISAIVVEYPAKFEEERKNIKEYYKSYTKHLIGFNVEI